MRSPAFERVESFVRGELIAWYQGLAELGFAYAAGSLVEGFTDDADLDLTFVWTDNVPPADTRLPTPLLDPEPAPQTYEQPNFNLDRIWAHEQQFDIKHVTVADVEAWIGEIESGSGFDGYPMPAIVMHALTNGVVLCDNERSLPQLWDRVASPPAAYRTSAADRWASSRAQYTEELRRCVHRGDGMLMHELTFQMVRTAFIAWFATHGEYWPHEKRLGTRLERMGHSKLAALEARVWTASSLEEALKETEGLLDALD